ncbi:MAG: PSD1 and planctomycete cytochrome C domain-containing protein [Lentisphaeraceae bacterium]|nr:PSD1 and planctomycete cytochrome C domain-containing protein [Lentisphaeraceae bacterium]
MKNLKYFLAIVCLSLSSSLYSEEINFGRDVLPILSDKCYHCHGPDDSHRKAKLRLDSFEHATQPFKKKKIAIVPGNPEASLVYKLVVTDDEDDIMPPADTDKKLSKKEKEIIYKWIKSGAKYEKHWAYVKPSKASLPKLKNKSWTQSPIDHYVLAKLEKNNLIPAPRAKNHTLIRRLHLDLTGLPPEPEVIQAYDQNPTPQAYEKLVDRLLASNAYAERMAMVWMDAARYSDSDGYQQDRTRQNWPWKDWVLNAYKNNKPFDQFTVEQLAGDLLPNSTPEQKLATTFNRNHMTNGEGGRDPEESRIDYVIDRVSTTGTVWLGLTLGCAQCHTHKFDPISHKEFYQMNAFFNNIDENGRAGSKAKPFLEYTPSINKAATKDATDWLAQVKEKEQKIISKYLPGLEKFLKEKAHIVTRSEDFSSWQRVDSLAVKATSGKDVKVSQVDAGEFIVSGPNKRHEDYIITTAPTLKRITGIRLKIKPDANNTNGGLSLAKDGNANFTDLKMFIRSKSTGTQKFIEYKQAKADYEAKVKGWKKLGQVKGILDDDPRTGWTSQKGDLKKEYTIVVNFKSAYELDDDKEVVIELHNRSLEGFKSMRRFSLELTDEYGYTSKKLGSSPSEILAKYKGNLSKLTPKERNEFREEYLSGISDIITIRNQLNLAHKQVKYYKDMSKKRKVMVMKERNKKRKTHVLLRGVWDKKGEVVEPGVLEEILPWSNQEPRNRLGLARWIVDKNNPLTARVTVNRYWQMIFGNGLVRTPEDFGLQGERPTHPKVLDWLAVEFMEKNWDVKHIIKTMVMTETYKMSSNSSAKLNELDPKNKLMARAPRFRMPSSMIRDSILKSTGLLTERFAGPPVFPYQPFGAWKDSTMGRFRYTTSPGKDAYRRSIYTFWRRSVAPTGMFDSSKRSLCSTSVVRTNTPLHALNLLNDQAYIEAARILAQDSLSHKATTQERLNYMALKILSRELNQQELFVLTDQVNKQTDWYKKNTKDSEGILSHGQIQIGSQGLNAAQVASYMNAATTLLNLDEALTRE